MVMFLKLAPRLGGVSLNISRFITTETGFFKQLVIIARKNMNHREKLINTVSELPWEDHMARVNVSTMPEPRGYVEP